MEVKTVQHHIQENRSYIFKLLYDNRIPDKEIDDIFQDVCLELVRRFDWYNPEKSDIGNPYLNCIRLAVQRVLSHRAKAYKTLKRTGEVLSLDYETEDAPDLMDTIHVQENRFPIETLVQAMREADLMPEYLHQYLRGVRLADQDKARGVGRNSTTSSLNKYFKKNASRVQALKESLEIDWR